ncbi:sodium:solute symporter family protein [Halobacterium rubrum]|uniref:sodium:solute symporter family protein n=1 Tax=Halobacterium TaxID=2239 RepID=UPI001F3181D1|nr:MULTISPECIES: sodium:solute symporter family protein [Halobacterium]MDH5019480.1 sodium:solute symporter family protein [Halobacterium rubrum]
MSLRSALQKRPDVESFFTADRDVGPLVGGASLTATQVSAGTLVGTVGIHYLTGVGFVWVWLPIWAGWLVSTLFVAPQLRAAGGFTVPDFLAARFGTAALRGAAAAFIAAVYLVYTTGQYVAGGVILDALVGVGGVPAAALVAVLALSYTVSGGMRASVYSDVAQVALLVGGLLAATAIGLGDVGGLAALGTAAASVDPGLVAWNGGWRTVVALGLAFGIGTTVAPYELSRVNAMQDPDTVRSAIGVAVAIQAVVGACIAVLGVLARVQYPTLANPDAALVSLAVDLFGPVVGSLLLLAALAAIVSTVDSVLLVTASAVAHDIYAETLPALGVTDDPGQHHVLSLARATIVAAAAVPVGLTAAAGALGGLVQFIVALYASLLGATLFAPLLAALHWPGTTGIGAAAGMVAGFAAAAGWHVLSAPGGPVADVVVVDPVVPGVAASALAVVAVSRW